MLRERRQAIPQSAQTIIPIASQAPQQTNAPSEKRAENTQSGITLLSDEVLVDEIQADIDGDNKEDKIIAAKKLSDQSIYLFIFLQNTDAQTFTRAVEIKTEATHAKTLSVYTLMVREYLYPVIAYNGMNSDSMQVFGMYALKIADNKIIRINSLAAIQADGQIILKNEQDNSISDYMISAYYSDKDAPNTLNQIEKQYTWNAKKESFVQTKEIKIPGKRIESQFLQKFQTGIVILFRNFLMDYGISQVQKTIRTEVSFLTVRETKLFFPLTIFKNCLLSTR